MNVPVRKQEIYQSDDGRRIEIFKKTSEVAFKAPSEADPNEKPEFPTTSEIYVGVAHVSTPMGPKEIKFEMPDCATIEQAFDKYYEYAEKAAETLMQRMEEARKQMSQKIVTAPAGALNGLEGNKKGGNSQLIIP